MTEDSGKLVAMANQIATFFKPYPEDEAINGIRDHILAFWTPKMRASLDVSAPGLDPLVCRAMAKTDA